MLHTSVPLETRPSPSGAGLATAAEVDSELRRQIGAAAARVREGGYLYIECAQWPELAGWDVVRSGRAGMVHYGLLQRATV